LQFKIFEPGLDGKPERFEELEKDQPLSS